jgi:hypothetical protein
MVRKMKFSLSSYWHAGSGAGSDAIADAVVLRDRHGLPIVPGKSVKGLVRDAMQQATLSKRVSSERIIRWFGSEVAGRGAGDGDEQEKLLEEGRFVSLEGELWFGSAVLSESWRRWAESLPDLLGDPTVQSLFTYLASTAIDENGTAREHSLRVREVAVPMDLVAEIRGPEDPAWVQDLQVCLPLLRAMGSRRNRGFGRVEVSLEDSK